MLRTRVFLALFLTIILTGSASAASEAREPHSRPAAKGPVVTDHIPQFDGPITMLTGPDGRAWAAWTYRASGELDIAVSSRDASATTWSTPVFFGRHSGSDEISPTIAVDSQGAIYLAFATTNPPRVAVARLAKGSIAWSEPVIVSGTEAASSPALLLVGDRLIVAYRTAQGVGMVDLPTVGGGYQTNGIQDGPEGVDPLGVKGYNPPSGTSSTPKP